jgi:hypothetical protein
MFDPQAKTEKPKEQIAPNVATRPSTSAAPAKPIVPTPKDPAKVATQPKP